MAGPLYPRIIGRRDHRSPHVAEAELIIRRSHYDHIGRYSGLVEADRRTRTGLAGYLRERGLTHVFCVGLTDGLLVPWTARSKPGSRLG